MFLNSLSRRPDFFNALVLRNLDEYVPYVRRFLEARSLPEDASEAVRSQVIADVDKFTLEDGVLHRKVKEGIIAPYIDFQFRGDLMAENA